jgi:hypothetical protein
MSSPLASGGVTPEVPVGVESAPYGLSILNITAPDLVKGSPGRFMRVSVVVAGSAVGALYDTNTTGGVAAANQFGAIPNAVGVYEFDWPCLTGIVVVPGTGQTVAVEFY